MSIEGDIRALLDAGDARGAATRTINAYGAEVLGLLMALMRNGVDAEEVFAQASADLWAGIRGFEGRSSIRIWFYSLARNAASRTWRAPHRRGARLVPLSEVSEIVARVRTSTAAHLRSDVKDKMRAIRDELEPDDRLLLVLRVDRAMSWNEIADVIGSQKGDDGASETRTRVAARLRKRFQLVKEMLRDKAREAGIVREE